MSEANLRDYWASFFTNFEHKTNSNKNEHIKMVM